MSKHSDEIASRFFAGTANSFILFGNVKDAAGKGRNTIDKMVSDLESTMVGEGDKERIAFPAIGRFSLTRGWDVTPRVWEVVRALFLESEIINFASVAGSEVDKSWRTSAFGIFQKPENWSSYCSELIRVYRELGAEAARASDEVTVQRVTFVSDVEVDPLPLTVAGVAKTLSMFSQLPAEYWGKKCGAVFIVEDAGVCFPATPIENMPEGERKTLSLVAELASRPDRDASNVCVVLSCDDPDDLHPLIAKAGFFQVKANRPDLETRLAIIRAYANKLGLSLNGLEAKLGVLTANLTWTQIARLMKGMQADGEVSLRAASEIKRRAVSDEFSGMLTIIEPLDERFMKGAVIPKQVLKGIADKMLAGDRTVPTGVILAGPPGTGKTRLVRVLSDWLGIPFFKFDFDSVQGQFVGQSGANLRRVLRFIEEVAPCGVFIDEIEQTGAAKRNEGGSGNPVAGELFSTFLSWLSEDRIKGKVLLVAATNRVGLLDEAMIREGRFGTVIPYLAPTEEERREILPAIFLENGISVTQAALDAVVGASKKYTPADLFAVVRKSSDLVLREKGEKGEIVTEEISRKALGYIVPKGPGYEKYEAEIFRYISDLEFVPEEYRQGAVAAMSRPRRPQESRQRRREPDEDLDI